MKRSLALASLVVTVPLFATAVAQQTYDVQTEFTGILQAPVSVDDAYAAADAIATDDACGEPISDLDYCRPCPSWCFTAGTLLMDRSTPDDAVLVTDTWVPGGNVLLNANEFDFDFRGGFEISAMRRNVGSTCWDLEARYARVDGWQAVWGPVAAPDNVSAVRYVGGAAYTVIAEAMLSAAYESHYDTFELNLRRAVGSRGVNVLAGFRFAELDERGLTIVQDIRAGLSRVEHEVGAVNDLYGFQLGADGHLYQRGRLSVDGLVRAGVYANRAVNNTFIRTRNPRVFASRATDNHPAFLGETGLTGTCQLVDCLAVRAGYRLMWLEGVAVASDQLGVSNPFTGTATVDTSGSPFYHGVAISLEYSR